MTTPWTVILCVGLTPEHIGANTPNMAKLASEGTLAPMEAVSPAVTTTAQASLLTGSLPQDHGIVANGWYFRDLAEVWLWRQSETLVEQPMLWDRIKEQNPSYKTLKYFWWYSMNSTADTFVTPRPIYHADGRKGPDFYASKPKLKDHLINKHGEFPLFQFWGPGAGIASTKWIAESFCTAMDYEQHDLSLVYLPHLDYDLQRLGPEGPHLAQNLQDLDKEVGKVIDYCKAKGRKIAIVSEYGLHAVDTPVYINRYLREHDLLSTCFNQAGELLDPGTSKAFAVCDHQIAHIYCKGTNIEKLAIELRKLKGVSQVLTGKDREEVGLNHERSGEIILLSQPNAWFVYDYWLDPKRKPDFAQCVEIHKKPGYDPRELLLDPAGGKARAAKALLKKKLGLRYVMNVIPSNAKLVKGSHGVGHSAPQKGPIFLSSEKTDAPQKMTEFADWFIKQVTT